MSLAQPASQCSLRLEPRPCAAAAKRASGPASRRQARRCAAAAAGGGEPPEQQAPLRRRELLLRSSAGALGWALLAEMTSIGGDGRTIVNSLLGAYGLPQLKATPGLRPYDDPEEPYTFMYPKAWVGRSNALRPGLYISDFNTADKLSLEVFPAPAPGASLAEAAIAKLMFPAAENGGDGRLELPPARRIQSEEKELDGKVYTYIAWPSSTTTRSGYEVKRKHLAVAAARRGQVYVLGCSARSDQWGPKKEALFQQIVASFRLL